MNGRGDVQLSIVAPTPVQERAWTVAGDLAKQIGALTVSLPKHRAVAIALSQALPDVAFRLTHIYQGMVYRPGRLLDVAGREIVACEPLKWLEGELIAAQQGSSNPNAWHERYEALRAGGVMRTAYRITPLTFAGRSGPAAADYWQARVDVEQEYPGPELPYVGSPRHLSVYSEEPDEKKSPLGAAVYRVRHLEHIGTFVERAADRRRREHPDVLERALARPMSIANFRPDGIVTYLSSEAEFLGLTPHPGLSRLQRWFQDWSESTARDAPMEAHWRFDLYDGGGPACGCLSCSPPLRWQDKPYCDATPQWVTRRPLPQFSKARIRDDAELRTWLERFDARAGHPMAWYFFMVHGDRITQHFGERVLEAIGRGALRLPDRDNTVLQRWAKRPYAF